LFELHVGLITSGVARLHDGTTTDH
jgi:hypothetical protein